jgi:regulation of enolase protein 1 (concanavalin A-like superfamily)
VDARRVSIVTEPNTDFWQRSYYGFRNDNAPALLLQARRNFTFTVRASFRYRRQFDQCGLVVYLDSENWFKASIENETSEFARLGSVVTNNG